MKYLQILSFCLVIMLFTACNQAEVNQAVDEMLNEVDNATETMEDSMDEMEDNSASDAQDDNDESEDDMDETSEDDMDDDSSADTQDDDTATSVYTTYSADVLANGETKVLFFHADWCPNCRANDARLQEWSADGEYTYPVYKVSYDSATALKAQLGVTSQDTFVLVDGEGNIVEGPITFPSQDQLRDILS